MFEYVSTKGVLINQTFCLICTTVIADSEGYVADIEHTEVEEKSGLLPAYYRAYYEMVAGRHNLTTESTEGGLKLENYNIEFYDKVSQRYNINNGKDKFMKLNSSEQFDVIFREALLPTAVNAANRELIECGYSEQELKEVSQKFKKLFLIQFRCTLDEFTLMNSNVDEAWKGLYDIAVGMPHTVIGLRKKVSNRESLFFRQNKDNLDVLLSFMRSYFNNEVGTPFKSYKNGFRISGIIIDTFAKYLIGRFIGEYAGIISSGSAVFEDEEGILLNGSETQDKMYTTSVSDNIDDFENLISLIDRGSAIYDIKDKRYFNLIAWRQNKIKKDVVEMLRNTNLAKKLDKLGLSIGGYLDNKAISKLFGRFSQDRRIRIENIDKTVLDGFNSNIDSNIARRKIDEWMKVWMDEYNRVNGNVDDSEMLENGRSILNFKYQDVTSDGKRTNRMTTFNHTMLKNLLIGIQALHVLESEISSMDYHFLAFPIKTCDELGYRLVTGLSLHDYLNFDMSKSGDIDIVCDVVGDRDLKDQFIIEDVSRRDGEIISVINNSAVIEDIFFDSLTDDDLAVIVDSESDTELLRFLRYNNIRINVQSSNNTETVRDVVFKDIVNSVGNSFNEHNLELKEYYENSINKDFSNVGMILSRVKFTTRIIELYSYNGNLTHNLDNKGSQNILDVTSLYLKYGSTPLISDLTMLSGRDIISSDIEELEKGLYCEQNIQYILGNRDNCSGKFYRKDKSGNYKYSKIFYRRVKYNDGKYKLVPYNDIVRFVKILDKRLKKVETGNNILSVDTLKVVCNSLTNYTGKLFGIKFNSNDRFYLPRAICFGVNLCVMINYIIYAIKGIHDHIYDEQSFLSDTNSDDVINVRLIIKTLKALDGANNRQGNMDIFNTLKICERLFSDFIESVDIDKINGAPVESVRYREFIFMDSIQLFTNEIDDIEERVIQYTAVARFVNAVLKNKAVFSVKFGGIQYSLFGFLRILEDILNFEKKQRDDEYLVSRVSRNEIDIDVQMQISSAITKYLSSNPKYAEIDESDTWLGNLMEYFNTYGKITIGTNIYNSIKLNYRDYEINEYGLLTLNGKVVHTIQYGNNGQKFIIVVTRYGLFRFRNGYCNLVDKMEDLKWMLY